MRRNQVAVVGAAETTELGVIPNVSQIQLHADAALNAIADAGLKLSDIDGIATAVETPQQIAHYLGITPTWVDGTSVGDAGLVHLRGLDNLVELFLDDTKRITDVGLPHLKGLIKLQELRLKRQRITDAGLVHLESLLALDKLRLGYDEGVTDAGLQSLAKIPALTYVNAEGTSITAAAVAKLKAVRPNLRIRIGK